MKLFYWKNIISLSEMGLVGGDVFVHAETKEEALALAIEEFKKEDHLYAAWQEANFDAFRRELTLRDPVEIDGRKAFLVLTDI